MIFDKPEDFYKVYDSYKVYEPQNLKPKHIRSFDREFWRPSLCSPEMSFLEIGCGTGLFLDYLRHKGVKDYLGVEQDQHAVDAAMPEISPHIQVINVWNYLENTKPEKPFDRIILFDVLEHFSYVDGAGLLSKLASILNRQNGMITLRVPNMASPWGSMYQFGDLTHQSAYTPKSIEQLALAAGLKCHAFLPQQRGSAFNRLTENCLHGFLSFVLTASPAIWTPNMIAVLKQSDN